MKKLILATAVALGALALTACQSTSNSPAPANNTNNTVCVNGTQVVNGVTVACQNGGYGYGVPGYGVGQPGYGQIGGCQYWTNYYYGTGAYYVPMMDPVYGPSCVNIGQQGYTTLVNYGYQGTPIYYQDQYYPGYGYGGGYYGGGGSGICIGGGNDDFFGGACFSL